MFDASTLAEADDRRADTRVPLQRPRAGSMGRRLARLHREAGVGLWNRSLARFRRRICPLDRMAELVPAGASVLDVGCGRGALLAQLALSGRMSSGAGVDADAGAVAQAQRMATAVEAQTGVRLRFATGAAERLNEAGRFDVVAMVDVMHHLPRDARAPALRKAAGALEPGGALIYKDMARSPLWRRLANKIHDLLLARQWIHEEPIERVEAWARQAGLRLEVAERIHMLWYAHELRVFRKPAGGAAETPHG